MLRPKDRWVKVSLHDTGSSLEPVTVPEWDLSAYVQVAGRRSQSWFDNSGQACEVGGLQAAARGLTVRLDGALTSELLVYGAVGYAEAASG